MTKYIIKTLLLLGITGVAFAQSMPAFEEVDANSDGQISAEEAAAIEGFELATYDTDQDGSLSREEYSAAQSE
jgi:predicted lipoprotein with Yx(FWY)xxD motif